MADRRRRDRRKTEEPQTPADEPTQGDARENGTDDESERQAAGASGTKAPRRAAPKRRTPARGSAAQQGDGSPGLADEIAAVPAHTVEPPASSGNGGKGKGARAAAARPATTQPPIAPDPLETARLLNGEHGHPHSILGAHPVRANGVDGVVVRAYHPEAQGVELLREGSEPESMERVQGGLFATFLPGAKLPMAYRVRFHFADGATWERHEPYRFMPTIGDVDLHLFNEGTHRRLWDMLGAHPRVHDGVAGTAFAVWAPNARRVSVVGDFNGWDGRIFPMRQMGHSGVWELFLPEIGPGALYKFELLTREGVPRVKTDPFAFKQEQYPGNASIVVDLEQHAWHDDAWMTERSHRDWAHEPMSIYEVHLGSWARVPEEGDRPLGYREIAPRLAEHVKRLGFTHIELLPVMEHPFVGSWGYQVVGYYAPTSRYGTPEDFKFFVDTMHQAGIGVILDWVPAHFPKDDWALRRFDGTALYEHEDPRLGEHPDWGTLIFNFGRNEVRNFLVANALYWLDEFHVDGLRVDAVASMLYLDYSRKAGEWLRNRYGGRENLEAIEFLRQMTETVRAEVPGAVTVAEESTAWPGVTKPASEGGLGFSFKWNMGWMHDTIAYFEKDPIYRQHHQGQLTFAMVYEYHEKFVMPLSHDEVVHGKGSLVNKMPGDPWQKFANLRTMLTYQWTRPGKKLVFMGTELAPFREWNHDISLDWHLRHDPLHGGVERLMEDLGRLYTRASPLWRHDHEPAGFQWIDLADSRNSVLSYVRRDGTDHLIVVLNLTPVPRENYRIGAPEAGTYVELLSTDSDRYGGSNAPTRPRVETERSPFHGFEQSVSLNLPPLAAIVLAPEVCVARWRDSL